MMRLLISACVIAVLLSGCSHKQTVVTSQGNATVERSNDNQTVTVTSKEGTTTYGKGAVDPAKLGLPLYPGATATVGGIAGHSVLQGSGEVVALSTSDSFDKVYQWYHDHMPAGSETMHMTNAGSSIATFQVGKNTDKEQRAVMITSDKDKTSIMLSHSIKP